MDYEERFLDIERISNMYLNRAGLQTNIFCKEASYSALSRLCLRCTEHNNKMVMHIWSLN